MYERMHAGAGGQSALKLEMAEFEADWFEGVEEGDGFDGGERTERIVRLEALDGLEALGALEARERPEPATERCSTILPVAANPWRERWGLDPPEMWLDAFELGLEGLEGDTPYEPSPLGPDTIPIPPDPLSAPTLRP